MFNSFKRTRLAKFLRKLKSNRARNQHLYAKAVMETLEERRLLSASYTLETLNSFSQGPLGIYPESSLLMNSSGSFYGTTSQGSVFGDGTIFTCNVSSGVLSTLFSFNGTNGDNPIAALVQDGSGNLFGTTINGGAFNDGTIFKFNVSSGKLSTLASFNNTRAFLNLVARRSHSGGNTRRSLLG